MAAQFEALLFRTALAPLATSLGFFGGVALDAVALSVARGHEGGLRAILERALARAGGAS
ncbi:MAG: hypothetical protein GIW95_07700 [Candidatus Eremiobacteraeota bacterium]|nr:hypothetical protein [Candidatus Eremiobacteraeota bacterium]